MNKIKTKRVPKKTKNCLLILGMHRSGTSALTRILSIAGAQLPATLMGANTGNDTGHWESLSLVNYHDALLKEIESAWDDWRMLEITRLPIKRRNEIKTEIKEIVDAEFSQAPLFVVKDPRICRFTTLFIDALVQGNKDLEVCVVLPFRNPLEVCESLERRDNMARADAALLWLRHVLEAEYGSRGRPRVILFDGAWMSDWREIFKSLNANFDIKWPFKQYEIAPQIKKFIKSDLRHHAHSTEDILLDSALRGWVGGAYQALEVLTQNSNSKAAQKQLDVIRLNFNNAVPLLDSLQFDVRTKRQKIKHLQEEIISETGKSEQLTVSLANQDKKLTLNTAELERLNIALQQAQGESSQLEATLSARGAEMMQMKEVISDSEIRAVKLGEALETQVEKTGKIRDKLAELNEQQHQSETAFCEEITTLQIKLEEETEQKLSKQEATKVLNHQLVDSQNKIVKLDKRMKQLHKSVSWKITTPMRLASRAVGSLVGKSQRRQRADMKLIRKSGLFDEEYYLKFNPDLNSHEVPSLLLHYLVHGGTEGRSPSPDFDSQWYLEQNPDVRQAGVNPLLHYLRHGKEEGRQRSESCENSNDDQGELKSARATNVASGAFVNQLADKRKSILFSDWHRRIFSSNRADAVQGFSSLTISVVTFNSAKWIPKFIESLLEEEFPNKNINLVFVDNGSTDNTIELIHEAQQKTESKFQSLVLYERPNNGYGCGNDFAIRKSNDEFVLVTNVDLEFHKRSILNIVSAALLDEADVASWEMRQCPYEHPKYYDPVTLQTSWSSHACILIRRDAYLQVGGYEKEIFMYGEDVELSYRFRDHGWKLRYLPFATITHHVDLHDSSKRPTQFSGSLSANILLRYRYGTPFDISAGETLLKFVSTRETDPIRQEQFAKAQAMVKKNRRHFFRTHRSKSKTELFPFSQFDYHIAREGHDVKHTPDFSTIDAPLVSVITRTHGNSTSYLREAIASVINQTYKNVEHIIVEDRTDEAKDTVEEVINSYGANIRYIKSDGVGRSRAGNCGLKDARGEFILFLDNDDLLFAEHIELLVQRLIEKKSLAAAYALAWDVQTNFEDDKNSYNEVRHCTVAPHKLPYSKERLQKENFIPIQAILFRRTLYERFGGFHEDLDYLEDWNLWTRYSQGGPFELISKTTSMYKTPSNKKNRKKRHMLLHNAYVKVVERNGTDLREISQKGL